jgi:hypothetical protein
MELINQDHFKSSGAILRRARAPTLGAVGLEDTRRVLARVKADLELTGGLKEALREGSECEEALLLWERTNL